MPNFSLLKRVALLACIVLAGAVPLAAASPPRGHHHAKPRVGGKVHRAWPHTGRPPRSALARWLARQVGPTSVKPCRRRVKHRLVRCRRAKPRRKGAVGSNRTLTMAALEPGTDGLRAAPQAVAAVSTGTSPLQLVRSYSIPTDDPSYLRLLNWSWTYDSAMTAAAFVVSGAGAEAEQLLDQLSALQHTDGSIEIAFDVASGQAEPVFRSGTIASVGLAGALYDLTERSSRYVAMEQRAAGYLISLQSSAGLVKGGPDVSWYSTQHNLLAYSFLTLLSAEEAADGNRTSAVTYADAASKIANAIDSDLLVHSGSDTYFIEGLGDNVQALDTDALGVMYLASRGETSLAQQVLSYAQSAFSLSGRSIALSSDPATYNMTYSAKGPFSGFKPYLGSGAPDVLWTEGTAELMLAERTLGQSTSALTQSLNAIAAVTPGGSAAPGGSRDDEPGLRRRVPRMAGGRGRSVGSARRARRHAVPLSRTGGA